jgi:hypothetical protein
VCIFHFIYERAVFFPPSFLVGWGSSGLEVFQWVVVILLLNYGFLLGWGVFISAAARG